MQTRSGRARLPISSPLRRNPPRKARRRGDPVITSIQIPSSGSGSDPDTSSSPRAQKPTESRCREETDRNIRPPLSEKDDLLLPDGPDASPRSLASSQEELQRPQIQRGGKALSREDSLFQGGELAGLLPNPSHSDLFSAKARKKLPDLEEIYRRKVQFCTNKRMSNPRPPQRRQIWSKQDSITLIKLVDSRAASWSRMEKEDHCHFNIPRNAQAYRDKARNMKVDFLISDAVLPRGFDLVTLSRKEIERLQMLGKNADRLEADVNKNGRPTNTEYITMKEKLHAHSG